MSEFPGRPSVLKGALVVVRRGSPIPSIILFQYNPERMRRRLEQQLASSDPRATSGDTARVLPPIESFDISIELDAVDQLESAEPLASTVGLHPQLAELELLLYPASATMILNQVLSLAGSAMVAPLDLPLVLFVYGPARIVPVRVTSIAITEQAFDQMLNPIQASVDLGLRSLSDRELSQAGPPFDRLGLVRQIAKEVLVASATVSSGVQRVKGLLPF